MPHQPLKGLGLGLATFALSLAAFMQVLDTSIANVSIPYIAGDLAVSVNQGAWVITSFAVGNAISLPLTGWLAQRIGAVRLMILSTLLFSIWSWLCGAATDFGFLIVSRFFQGIVGGPLIPLSQSLLLQNYPEEKKNFGLSFFLTVIVVGPILGPILGGWITEDYRWNWIFYINIPVGLLSSFINWQVLKNRESIKIKTPSDWIGLLLLIIGIGSLQILLDKGEQWDWFSSNKIRLLGGVSLICLVLLYIWERTQRHPLLDLDLFKNRNFAVGTFITSISYMIFFGAIVITPLWLQTQMGYTAYWAGLAVAPMGILPFFFTIPIAKLMNRVKLRYLIFLCFFILCITFFIFSNFTTDISFEKIALSRLLLGLAICFYLNPLVAISHQSISSEKLSSASGLFHFCRIFAGGAGTSLFIYLWDRRAILHQLHLGEFVNRYNQNTEQILSQIQTLNISFNSQKALLETLNQAQGYMLATNDIFWFSAWICIGMIPFIFLFKKKKRTSAEQMISGEG
ncbi:MAG: DHA2 family efflux MFS transporter permease subunit [Anaerolineae bacterium]